MTEKAIVKKSESRITPWGDRNEIREISRRVQLMAPGAKKLSENEALALAQGAVAHGLDPFNGEIWFIPGSGLMAGIKGLRKAARNQIDGNFWTEFEKLIDPDERQLLMIPEDALAFRCILRDSETIRTYSEGWKKFADDGVPTDLIPEILGKRPYTEGVGFVKVDEKTKMDRVQCAMKRSEADALKRRFDLPFAVPTEPNGEIIDVEWSEAKEETEEEISEKATEASANLFGPESDPKVRMENQWEPEILDLLLRLKLVDAKQQATKRLNHSIFFTETEYGELNRFDAVVWNVIYNEIKEDHPDSEVSLKAELADLEYKKADEVYLSRATDLLASLEE